MRAEVTDMKKMYREPDFEWVYIGAEDFLTLSDNDAPFIPPTNSDDDGWSGYH